MLGKIFVVDGCDSSGKETQAKALYERLLAEGYKVRFLSFPNYDSDASALVKMYLNGDFGSNADDVDSYVASSFYAVDRYASYMTDWKPFYQEGGILICDRYTTSNMVHQASKIEDVKDKEVFLEWLSNLEYGIYKLPIPNEIIFLDMPPDSAQKLMADRKNKITGEIKKDIHEKDFEYLKRSYYNAIYVAEKFNWHTVNCTVHDEIKSVDEISEEIYKLVREKL